ncbi:MAG: DUF4351 domain-containing protein [Leptolyngbyaceae cyanobacterium RM1_406_9]|nr:DUF4351 domain-containing protein [Leptolyngbyaceae cyanobacterium RM1_406_9]
MFDNISKFLIELRLWEQPTEVFFQRPGLLPYAVLSQTGDRPSILRQVAQTIDTLPNPRQQANLSAATGILAGLVLNKQLIRRLLRREIMQESVIYRELRAEAREEGLRLGREDARREAHLKVLEEVKQQLRQEILEEVRQQLRQDLGEEARESRRGEAYLLVIRLLKRRIGSVSDEADSRVNSLSLSQLEDLGEALLDFSTVADLEAWLEAL